MTTSDGAPARPLSRWLKRVGWVAAGGLAFTGVGLALAHRATAPPRFPWRNPRRMRDVDYEDVSFVTEDGLTIHGWLAVPENPRGAIVLCHGYLDTRLEMLPHARFLTAAGYACLLIDHRCNGMSDGNRCTIGFLESLDVLAATHYLAERPETKDLPLAILGHSMGGVAALMAAERIPHLRAMIADGVFPSLRQAADRRARLLMGPAGPLVHRAVQNYLAKRVGAGLDEVSPLRVVEELTDVPVFFIHSDWDIYIPIKVAEEMYERAAPPKRFWRAPRTPHCRAVYWHSEEYQRRVLEFLRDSGM